MAGGLMARLAAVLFNIAFYCANPVLCRKFLFKKKYLPNIACPTTLSEKYLWRKIVDRNPEFGVFCDKLATKEYIRKNHPDVATARVFWRGRNAAELPVADIVFPVVFKVNSAWDTNLRLDDAAFDRDALSAVSENWLRVQHAKRYGEWAYSLVAPTLFVEEDLSDRGRRQIVDFAVYVFAGEITHISAMKDKGSGSTSFARFDETGRRMPVRRLLSKRDTLLPDDFELPVDAGDLCNIARRIAKDSDHLRIDLLWNGHTVYLTEITVYSNAGYVDYDDTELIERMARNWDLRRSWLFRQGQSGWRSVYSRWLLRQLNNSPK